MRKIVLVAENIRSAHNVGSLLRSAEGLGLFHVYLTGYTPYPPKASDNRLPHEQKRALAQIAKTSLGAEETLNWSHDKNTAVVLASLKKQGFLISALEQTKNSMALKSFKPVAKTALIVGNEIDGVSRQSLDQCDVVIEIPMRGSKESFNVTVAAAIAAYHLVTAE